MATHSRFVRLQSVDEPKVAQEPEVGEVELLHQEVATDLLDGGEEGKVI